MKKKIIIITFVSMLIAIYILRVNGYIDPDILFELLHEYPVIAPSIFITIYIVSSVFLIPTLPLNIGAGVFWGPFYGALYSFTGSIIGLVACFLIARYFKNSSLIKRINFKAWNWIFQKSELHGWKIVAFIRINPIFPTNIFSYLFGLTHISFKVHFWTSFIFLAPLTFLVSAFGSSIKDIVLIGEMDNMKIGLSIFFISLLLYYFIQLIVKKFSDTRYKNEF